MISAMPQTWTFLLLWFSILLCPTPPTLVLCTSRAVLLDSVSIKRNVILLLDTFFHILIFHGELVAQRWSRGYQDKEGYENFKKLLEVPVAEATRIVVPVSKSALSDTPLKICQDLLPPVLCEPVTCKPPCRAILNPYWWETIFLNQWNFLDS